MKDRQPAEGRRLPEHNEELVRQKTSIQNSQNAEKYAVIGRLARILAHEVRNPLTNINLSLEQLRTEIPGDNEVAEMFLDMIQRNSLRINQMLTELLKSVRIGELNLQSSSVTGQVKKALADIDNDLQAKKITVDLQLAEEPLTISMDEQKIGEALLNVITNAVEAMHEGGILSIKAGKRDDFVIIEIGDNGAGIKAEFLERVFEPYYSTKKKGSGLGLVTSYNIVLAHDGQLLIDSIEGAGTKVTVVLPFLQEASHAE